MRSRIRDFWRGEDDFVSHGYAEFLRETEQGRARRHAVVERELPCSAVRIDDKFVANSPEPLTNAEGSTVGLDVPS